jgi:hypothetical protein
VTKHSYEAPFITTIKLYPEHIGMLNQIAEAAMLCRDNIQPVNRMEAIWIAIRIAYNVATEDKADGVHIKDEWISKIREGAVRGKSFPLR